MCAGHGEREEHCGRVVARVRRRHGGRAAATAALGGIDGRRGRYHSVFIHHGLEAKAASLGDCVHVISCNILSVK